ncbi:MAG TPA: hypothetical protein PLP33_24955 [Leptospiraceae bacterium]|nr:hypothetical protein [Leptospiraceae bacterium]
MQLDQRLKTYLEFCVLEYPTLHKNFESVLARLFLSYHFKWENGELFDWDEYPENYSREETYKKNHAELSAKVETEKKELEQAIDCLKSLRVNYLYEAENKLAKYERLHNNIDALLDNFIIDGDKLKNIDWGRMTDSTCLLHVPENVTDFYLKLISDFLEKCLRVIHGINYYRRSHDNLKWTATLKKAAKHINRIRRARKLKPIQYWKYKLSDRTKKLPDVRKVPGIPEIGDIVEVMHRGKLETCRVESWMRIYAPPVVKRKSREQKMVDHIMKEIYEEENICKPREETMQWCLPSEATHLSLGHFYKPISECKVVGKVDWSIDSLHTHRMSAIGMGIKKEVLR